MKDFLIKMQYGRRLWIKLNENEIHVSTSLLCLINFLLRQGVFPITLASSKVLEYAVNDAFKMLLTKTEVLQRILIVCGMITLKKQEYFVVKCIALNWFIIYQGAPNNKDQAGYVSKIRHQYWNFAMDSPGCYNFFGFY